MKVPTQQNGRTQTIRRLLPTNCLSVFDHFAVLVLKGLQFQFINRSQIKIFDQYIYSQGNVMASRNLLPANEIIIYCCYQNLTYFSSQRIRPCAISYLLRMNWPRLIFVWAWAYLSWSFSLIGTVGINLNPLVPGVH